jgi:hypothetical protein
LKNIGGNNEIFALEVSLSKNDFWPFEGILSYYYVIPLASLMIVLQIMYDGSCGSVSHFLDLE